MSRQRQAPKMREYHASIARTLQLTAFVDVCLCALNLATSYNLGSQSLYATAVYELADLGADLLPLAATYLAMRPGWSKVQPLAELAATGLIAVGGVDLIGSTLRVDENAGDRLPLRERTYGTTRLVVQSLLNVTLKEYLYRILTSANTGRCSVMLTGHAWHQRADACVAAIPLAQITANFISPSWGKATERCAMTIVGTLMLARALKLGLQTGRSL